MGLRGWLSAAAGACLAPGVAGPASASVLVSHGRVSGVFPACYATGNTAGRGGPCVNTLFHAEVAAAGGAAV